MFNARQRRCGLTRFDHQFAVLGPGVFGHASPRANTHSPRAGIYVAPSERMFNENQRYNPKQQVGRLAKRSTKQWKIELKRRAGSPIESIHRLQPCAMINKPDRRNHGRAITARTTRTIETSETYCSQQYSNRPIAYSIRPRHQS
jgi:hypothetical protein